MRAGLIGAEASTAVAVASGMTAIDAGDEANPFRSPELLEPPARPQGKAARSYLTWAWLCFGLGVLGYVAFFTVLVFLGDRSDDEMIGSLLGSALLLYQLAAGATGIGLAAAAKPRGGRHSAATILPSLCNALLLLIFVALVVIGLATS